MTVLTKPLEPMAPTPEEQQQAVAASRFLASLPGEDFDLQLTTGQSPAETLPLPAPARRLLYEALRQIAAGHAVTVHPLPTELTTQQAADYLNVSRPYLIKMLDDSEIPFHMTGTHRRVYFEDIKHYKEDIDAKRREVLRELAAEAQELGLGY